MEGCKSDDVHITKVSRTRIKRVSHEHWPLSGLSLVTISVCDSHAQDLTVQRRGGDEGEEEPQSSTEELSCVFSRLAVSKCPN